jgi:hypothetical protein
MTTNKSRRPERLNVEEKRALKWILYIICVFYTWLRRLIWPSDSLLRKGFSPSMSITPCNYHSTTRPYSNFIYQPQMLCNCKQLTKSLNKTLVCLSVCPSLSITAIALIALGTCSVTGSGYTPARKQQKRPETMWVGEHLTKTPFLYYHNKWDTQV